MAKPFERVERLPVPPEVAESFKKLSRAEKGAALSRHHAFGSGSSSPAQAARQRGASKLAEATAEAASHFGGDVEKMTTHFKRFVRWGGRAMGVADMVLPKESFNKGMKEAEGIMQPAKRHLRPTRRKA